MKIYLSTKDCNAYNSEPNNALAIAQGLIQAWEPDDRILREEKEELVRAKSEEAFQAYCGQFWTLVLSLLSPENRALYDHSQTTEYLSKSYDTARPFTVDARVQKHSSGYRYDTKTQLRVKLDRIDYSPGHRDSIYPYKPNEIAKLAVDQAFALKVANKLTEGIMHKRQYYSAETLKEQNRKQRDAIYEANKNMFNSMVIWGSDLTLGKDGRLTARICFTGTLEQWEQIKAFRDSLKDEVVLA